MFTGTCKHRLCIQFWSNEVHVEASLLDVEVSLVGVHLDTQVAF